MRTPVNFITNVDSYKLGGHWNMSVSGLEYAYAYGEARVGSEYDETLFYSLQGILQEYMEGVVVTQGMIIEAKELTKYHLGDEQFMHLEGWQTIVDEFGGKLPVEIKAVPEGTLVPVGNVLFTIVNTDPRFPWLPNYMETQLMRLWYGTTVATRSYNIVKFLKGLIDTTSDIEGFEKFMLHDFGSRSTTTTEAAYVGGSAHLINSYGTDTVSGIQYIVANYEGDLENIAFSVPATEHSIATAYGPNDGENYYVQILMDKYPHGILSLVADTYGIENFVTNVIGYLKDEIVNRNVISSSPVTKVVIRPDSPRFEDDTPEDQVLWIVEELEKIFGSSVNSKGYKVLHPSVGVLYGDGLSVQEIENIYNLLVSKGWSAENCIVGQGGGLLQKLNRDTCRFAIKASQITVNGKQKNIQKNPSDKTKASKTGRLKLVEMDGKIQTINSEYPLYHDHKDLLQTVFLDGEMVKTYTLDEVRKNTGLW